MARPQPGTAEVSRDAGVRPLRKGLEEIRLACLVAHPDPGVDESSATGAVSGTLVKKLFGRSRFR